MRYISRRPQNLSYNVTIYFGTFSLACCLIRRLPSMISREKHLKGWTYSYATLSFLEGKKIIQFNKGISNQ